MEYFTEHKPNPAPADEEDATWQVWGGARVERIMLDLDNCEKMAIMEAEPMVADMVKNVPEAQKAEASDWVRMCINKGIALMKAQVRTEEMVED